MHIRGSKATHRRINVLLRSGRPWSGERDLQRADGSCYREEVTISPVRDLAGHVTSFVSVGRDITQVRQMQASIKSASTGRAAFARALARLQQRETIEETGQDITAAVAALPGVEIATLLWFGEGTDTSRSRSPGRLVIHSLPDTPYRHPAASTCVVGPPTARGRSAGHPGKTTDSRHP